MNTYEIVPKDRGRLIGPASANLHQHAINAVRGFDLLDRAPMPPFLKELTLAFEASQVLWWIVVACTVLDGREFQVLGELSEQCSQVILMLHELQSA